MDQGRKHFGINAFRVEAVTLREDRDRVVAVQAFLMAGHHAEIADPGVGLQCLAKRARGVLDKDRVGGVQLCKSLLVLANWRACSDSSKEQGQVEE